MKKVLFIVMICLVGCDNIQGNKVTHSIEHDEQPLLLCGERNCYATYVWFDNKIVWSKYDPVSKVNDSLVVARQKQASVILNALRK